MLTLSSGLEKAFWSIRQIFPKDIANTYMNNDSWIGISEAELLTNEGVHMDLGQVFTNAVVAEYMILLFEKEKNASFLDPCFGGGAFIDAAIRNGYKNIEGFEIDKALYDRYSYSHPEAKIVNCDFIKADETQKYDGIIMNPPYIRQEKIDQLKPLGITKAKLRRRKIFNDLPKTANMYMYFIFKALKMLKADGELVVIFPGSWLQARSGKLFEKTLFQRSTLLKQIDIKGEAFVKNALVDVVILHIKNGIWDYKASKIVAEISDGHINENPHESYMLNMGFSCSFSEVGKVRRGLTTGCNEMYINPPIKESKLINIISTPKHVQGYSTDNTDFDKILLVKDGFSNSKEMNQYLKRWENKISKDKSPKTIYEKIKNNKDNWCEIKLIDSKGIIFSYFVRNDMKFIFNAKGYLTRDNFYIISPLIDDLVLFSMLNNYYTYYQLELIGKKYGAGLLKLQRYDMENLIFPSLNDFSEIEIDDLKSLSINLINSGKKDIIDEITKIISAHSLVDFPKIKDEYIKLRERRLNKV